MAKPRKYRKYVVKVGRKTVHGGITSRPLEERETEHKQKWPTARIDQVGRATTEDAAREWEKKQGYT